MKRFLSSVVSIWVVAAALQQVGCAKLLPQPHAGPSAIVIKEIWQGTSAGYDIRWTTGDIVASRTGSSSQSFFSELGQTIVDFHAISKQQTSDCDLVRQAKLESVVGTIISVRSDDTMKCTNGTNGTWSGVAAFDLRHPKSRALLSAYIPAPELHALNVKASHFCKSIPKQLLNSFTFSELHGSSLIVAVTLPRDCSQSEVDLAVNTPATLKQALALAAERKAGFLAHDQAAMSAGQVTTVYYHYRTSVE